MYYITNTCVDSQTRSSMSSVVMAQMSDMLIHVFNTPSLRTAAVQDCK